MSEVIYFIPKHDGIAKDNLKEFIKICKSELTIFGDDLDWENRRWDISDTVIVRGYKKTPDLIWSNFDTSKSNRNAPMLQAPYVDFAKAFVRYTQGTTKRKSHANMMSALRVLERALIEVYGSPDIKRSDPSVFNHAAALVKEKYFNETPYSIGSHLKNIMHFINDMRLVSVGFVWENPLPKNDNRHRIGKKFDEARLNKLPSPEALDALPKAYCMATKTEDVIIASIAALLLSANARINEVFRLNIDCEVEEVRKDGSRAYGIRWHPSKGADAYVKWIPNTMVDIAKEALSNIRKQTQQAREIAEWYEKNPGILYLPKGLRYLREKELLSREDCSQIIGIKLKSVTTSMKDNNVKCYLVEGQKCYKFTDVERYLLQGLPEDFPMFDKGIKLKYSDALCVVCKYQLSTKRMVQPVTIEGITTQNVNTGLGAAIAHGKSSIFSRLGFKAKNGNDIKITSHQFRHYLNTIAQRGGLSQLEVAAYSGRTSIKQNDTYDHLSGREMVDMVREITDGSMFGPLAEVMHHMPVTKEEFLEIAIPTAHVTEYGWCPQDWAMKPCQKFLDCINCTQHICVKGEKSKEARIKDYLQLILGQLKKAKEELEEETYGSDRWVEVHKLTAARLIELVRILDDPDVPEGAIIQLANPNEFSPVRAAIESQKRLAISA